jgi:hypothetical protein
MTPATQDSGERVMTSGPLVAGDQSEAEGGATAPIQHAAQALQYELLAVGGVSRFAGLSAAAAPAEICIGEPSY